MRDETQSRYGDNTRLELFLRSAYFLEDYPFIGGGLGSFPGLYSQYLLVIPHHYFINSYNLFLDVAIEQGVIGGLVFLLIYVGSVWHASQALLRIQQMAQCFFVWISLFVLMIVIVHGMFYDYLYSGIGTFLLFLPVWHLDESYFAVC
jgi:O-antigen ligase